MVSSASAAKQLVSSATCSFNSYGEQINSHCVQKTAKAKKLSPSLREIQTHKRLQRTLCIMTKTQSANFRGNPLYQATKRHLTVKRRKTVKNASSHCCFRFFFFFFYCVKAWLYPRLFTQLLGSHRIVCGIGKRVLSKKANKQGV